jgi:hypothetical protein
VAELYYGFGDLVMEYPVRKEKHAMAVTTRQPLE